MGKDSHVTSPRARSIHGTVGTLSPRFKVNGSVKKGESGKKKRPACAFLCVIANWPLGYSFLILNDDVKMTASFLLSSCEKKCRGEN